MCDDHIEPIDCRAHNFMGDRKGTWTIVALAPRRGKARNITWLARCDCGHEKTVMSGNWAKPRMGMFCPVCSPKVNYNQLPPGESGFNIVYGDYQARAVARRLDFDLTRDEFRTLTGQPCSYCGTPPSQRRSVRGGTPYVYSGLDRIDSNRGYVPSNVTPCCLRCNQSKSDRSLDEWIAHIRLLHERLCLLETPNRDGLYRLVESPRIS